MNIEIGVIIAIMGAIIGAASFFLGRITSAKQDGEWKGELKADLKHIQASIDRLNDKVETNSDKMDASIRRLHKRIDDHLRLDHKMNLPNEKDSDE